MQRHIARRRTSRAGRLCRFGRGFALATAIVALPLLALASAHPAEDEKEPKTIGDIVSVAGLHSYPTNGVGLVVGLDGTGCDPVPGPDRSQILTDMQKRGIPDAEEILRSPSTALVRIRARIPPGVRSCKSAGCWCKLNEKTRRPDSPLPALRLHKGDTFDVEVDIPTRDTAASLKGGWLLQAWLYEVAELPGSGTLSGHVLGKAEGPVLVTGGLDGSDGSPADLRRGRVLGGGICNEDRNFAIITESDRTAKWSLQVASRINQRFPAKSRDGKSIAEPKDGQRILLKVPARYRQNVARYLEVLKFMPLSQDGGQEADRMMRWGEQLMDPSLARISALRLEGIGHRAVETLKKAVDSGGPDVRFFAAEALAYLDEPKAGEVLAEAARDIAEYRAHALTALSSLDEPVSPKVLHELLGESGSVELRYGAYRALRALDPDDSAISGESIGDQLYLHQVNNHGTPFVHLTSRDRAEIVVFGRELKLEPPLHLNAGNKIMISAPVGSTEVQIRRFEVGEPVRQIACELRIDQVIRKALAMGASYPDIVGMLVQADRQHNLPGRLEIDAMPDPTRLVTRLQRIADSSTRGNETAAMPNLYRWLEPRKSAKPGSNSDGDESESVASTDDSEQSKDRKPSLWDRLRRRSAN